METSKKHELCDDTLQQVSGGGMYDVPGTVYDICPYCAGYILTVQDYVEIPTEQMRCVACGYMPAFPETVPNMEEFKG